MVMDCLPNLNRICYFKLELGIKIFSLVLIVLSVLPYWPPAYILTLLPGFSSDVDCVCASVGQCHHLCPSVLFVEQSKGAPDACCLPDSHLELALPDLHRAVLCRRGAHALPNFYPNLPIFLNGYIRHIHDILQL